MYEDYYDIFIYSGSHYDDVQGVQDSLRNSRLPQYVKDEIVQAHNWRYCDFVSTDTEHNTLWYGVD